MDPAFDRLACDSICRKLGLPSPLPDEAQLQVTMPLRRGGLGLRPAARVAPAAYLASVSQAIGDVSSLRPQDDPADIPTQVELASCLRSLHMVVRVWCLSRTPSLTCGQGSTMDHHVICNIP